TAAAAQAKQIAALEKQLAESKAQHDKQQGISAEELKKQQTAAAAQVKQIAALEKQLAESKAQHDKQQGSSTEELKKQQTAAAAQAKQIAALEKQLAESKAQHDKQQGISAEELKKQQTASVAQVNQIATLEKQLAEEKIQREKLQNSSTEEQKKQQTVSVTQLAQIAALEKQLTGEKAQREILQGNSSEEQKKQQLAFAGQLKQITDLEKQLAEEKAQREKLQTSAGELAKQQVLTAEQQQKISVLEKQLAEAKVTPALNTEEQSKQQLAATQPLKEIEALKAQLAEEKSQHEQQKNRADALVKQQIAGQELLAVFNKQLIAQPPSVSGAVGKPGEVANKQVTELENELKAAQTQLKALQGKQTVSASESVEAKAPGDKPTIPKKEDELIAYALGMQLGDKVQDSLTENAELGLSVNTNWALLGLVDTVKQQLQVDRGVLMDSLNKVSDTIRRNMLAKKQEAEKSGKQYQKEFAAKPQVNKDPAGFHYRIEYGGDNKIPDNANIMIAVKESLVDGTVIEDMDVQRRYVTQPLSKYPPVFKAALARLRDHGSMTLVVPPELAYGDRGLAPLIPPGSTIIYNIRIVGVTSPK
ncbi:FKBP-type peptidyl-prolyl cis-trans isomerase, partial [Budviciaceae bacterium BWR-B9]